MNEQKGRFIVFEGIDGSGKSTQIQLLKNRIQQLEIPCYETKEPTDGPVGSLVHQCMTGRTPADERTIAALFAADRLDHLQNSTDGLCDKINHGVAVLSDRYILSSYAYQSVRVPLDWVMEINSLANDLLKPDCHIFIDVDPDITMERMAKGRFHKELFETKDRLVEVRNRYFELFNRFQDAENIIIINGNVSIDDISNEIWNKVSYLFA